MEQTTCVISNYSGGTRMIVSTVGTSIARGIAPPRGEGGVEAYARAIRARCGAVRRAERKGFLAAVCGEAHCLEALEPRAGDRLALLHSDTGAGAACAAVLAEVLRGGFPLPVTVARVPGLQTGDADRLRAEGLAELHAALDRCRRGLRPWCDELVLNVTGGFKALAGYVANYGWRHQARVVCLAERSGALLTLAPPDESYSVLYTSRSESA